MKSTGKFRAIFRHKKAELNSASSVGIDISVMKEHMTSSWRQRNYITLQMFEQLLLSFVYDILDLSY